MKTSFPSPGSRAGAVFTTIMLSRATFPSIALSALVSLGPQVAHAQEEANAPEVTSDETQEGESAAEEVVITEKARSLFRAGVNLLQDPDGARYEEAYRQFKAAYAESPSWKILGNLGVTAMKLERDGEAIDAFEQYLKEGGDGVTPEERSQFQRDVETLKATVATINLSASQPGVALTDERITNRGDTVRNQYRFAEDGNLSLRIRPGHHKITARLSGHNDAVWEFDANASGSYEHAFELQKPQPATTGTTASPEDAGTYRPMTTGIWVGVGLTGAFTVGAVVTGAMALSANGEYDDANAEGDPNADDMRKKVKNLNLVTDVMIGAAVVSAAVTTVLYVTRPEKRRESALQFVPSVGPRGAVLHLSGSF